MELKEYQRKALDAFDRWLRALETAQERSETGIAALQQSGVDVPAELRNYPRTAWQTLVGSGEVAVPSQAYVERTDGAGRPIPHVCFKVPTGGGKTLLAAAALERLNRHTGLTLWITPTRAIYQQTWDALRNREHPYRQMLERASGGRVKLLEKETPFTAGDMENYLCVMLLMLPATNRQKGREFLRMFRDSGRYPTLFPDSDDALGDGRLLEQHPDLERTSEGGPVKHSLFNLFKMLRPVVVLDEAHKAYGRANDASEFVQSVNRLNPRMVIELSATPNRNVSNLLVDITGVELRDEEMIKLPVQVTSFTGAEWQYTLGQAYDELERVAADAVSLEASEGRYIRPIAVVRVERTGKDQRDGERVHAEDVREYLTLNLGVPAEQVRVKSAENDELGNEDLLSGYSPVRWIITRAALMEGWDCSFAYLLVMLDNTSAQRAITQLVGRVMRQPHARRTGREALDQCYVYCWNTDVGVAVGHVKNGLEQEGMTGLGDDVISQSGDFRRITLERREQFRGQTIFLPMVNHRDGDGWRELDYQQHILPHVEWASIGVPETQGVLDRAARRQWATVDVVDEREVYHPDREIYIDKTVNISWFARRLADIVTNPWQAARIASEMVGHLRSDGLTDDDVYDQRANLAASLRDYVTEAVENLSKGIFLDKLNRKEISFDLESSGHSFRVRESYDIPVSVNESTLQNYGRPLQLSLFEPVLARQFDNDLERNFARYLDEQKALHWWHRVAVRQQGDYYLRGWKRERIWPDFVAMAGDTTGKPHVLVFETKGQHLEGNPDTEYKRKVLETLENTFNGGTLKIYDGPAKGTFRLVFSEEEFPTALANLQGAYTA